MQNTQNLLSVEGLKKYYPLPKKHFFSKEKRFLRANDGITLTIRRGETFGLVGESGSGKSTLGRALLQLDPPTDGKVIYYGADGEKTELTSCKDKEMRALRRRLQMIFQDPYSSLNPRMTVGRIIGEGVWTHGIYPRRGKELNDYVLGVMEACGLQPHYINRYPHEFSGGQRQRICIARALALNPEFVVCDECVSALDVSVQAQILNLLARLKEERALTYLFISHDLSVVRHVADRIAVMYLGKIVETGDTEGIFTNPKHPYTIALLSAIPSMEETGEKILLQGQLPSAVSPPTGCPFHTRCFMAKEICRQQIPPLEEVETGRFAACHFAEKELKEKREIAFLGNGEAREG